MTATMAATATMAKQAMKTAAKAATAATAMKTATVKNEVAAKEFAATAAMTSPLRATGDGQVGGGARVVGDGRVGGDGCVWCPLKKGRIAAGRCVREQLRVECGTQCASAVDVVRYGHLARPGAAFCEVRSGSSGSLRAGGAMGGVMGGAVDGVAKREPAQAALDRGRVWRRVSGYLARKGRSATVVELMVAGGFGDRRAAMTLIRYYVRTGRLVRSVAPGGEYRFALLGGAAEAGDGVATDDAGVA